MTPLCPPAVILAARTLGLLGLRWTAVGWLAASGCTNTRTQAKDETTVGYQGNTGSDAGANSTRADSGANSTRADSGANDDRSAPDRGSSTNGSLAHDASTESFADTWEAPDSTPALSFTSDAHSESDVGVVDDAREWRVVTELAPDEAGYIAAFDVAASGSLGLVGYREYNKRDSAVVSAEVVLQRFDAQATQLGNAISVALVDGESFPSDAVAVATDGTDCVVCWEQDVDIACVPVQGDAVLSRGVRYFKGQSPKVVHTGENWVLAYFTEDDSRLLVEALDTQLNRVGDVLNLPSPAMATMLPVLSANDGHVSLLAGAPDPNDDNAHLYRMNSMLELEHPVVSMDRPLGVSANVASVGDHSLVSLSSPYTGFLLWVDATGQLSSLEVPGGGKRGNSQEIAVSHDGFFVAWYATATQITTEFIDGPLSGERGEVASMSPTFRMITFDGTRYGVSLREREPQRAAFGVEVRQVIAATPLQ